MNFRRGIFVEAGANDGLNQSNTAYFERYLGWRGLLVEPVPELAEKCRENRRRSIVHQCALVSREDPRDELSMTYCNLMSIVDGARGNEDLDRGHIETGRKFLSEGDAPRRLTVPTRTLDSLLVEVGIAKVDLLSLDVEGCEPEALRGLELDRLAPKWILVEANDPNAVEDSLKGHYELVALLSHHDRLYRVKE